MKARRTAGGQVTLAAGLALVALGANLALLAARQTAGVVSGDEGTFLAMAASLAMDGDVAFDERDLERLEQYPRGGRRDVILQDTPSGIRYSKPVLYPLAAAPFYRVAGDAGVVALNVLAFAVAMSLAWLALRRRADAADAALTLVTFAGTGVLPAYLVWTMSDSLQVSLVIAGSLLCAAVARPPADEDRISERVLGGAVGAGVGGLLLGLAAAVRYPNALAGAAAVAMLVVARRPRRAALVAVLLVVGVGLGLGLNAAIGGAAVPYKTLRATFTPDTGYPAGAEAESALEQFRAGEATQRVGLRPRLLPAMTGWSTVYFFVGRHSGVLLYFPAAAILLWAFLRHPDLQGLVAAAAAGGIALFYLVWLPWNYFGGATFLGNRYFLTAYALLLLVPARLPSRRSLAVAWLVGLAVFASALASTLANRKVDRTSQMHAYAGVFRLLPYETTARDLDGRRDRYWSDEFLRFVDPYAQVEEFGFRLTAGSPAAEMLTASGRETGVIRLLAASDAPGGKIVYRDWGKRLVFDLRPTELGFGRVLEIVPSPSWRRHAFWWDETGRRRWARTFRLRLAGNEDASAEVRVLGPYRLVPRFYRGRALGATLPAKAAAASRETVPLRLENAGQRYWSSADPIPVLAGFRIYRLPRLMGDEPQRTSLAELPNRVEPGASIDLAPEIGWPQRPGSYELVVDLTVGGFIWFGDWCGAPLATREVEVVEADDPGTPE